MSKKYPLSPNTALNLHNIAWKQHIYISKNTAIRYSFPTAIQMRKHLTDNPAWLFIVREKKLVLV